MPEVLHETLHLLAPLILSGSTEDCGWMNGGGGKLGAVELDELAVVTHDTVTRTKERPGGSGTHRHQHLRLDSFDLCIEPRQACAHLARGRSTVQTTPASRLPLEMLHDIRDVRIPAIDASLRERAVHQLAGRADERPAVKVLVIAGNLAHHEQLRTRQSFAEDRLRRIPVERTAATPGRRPPERAKVPAFGKESLSSRELVIIPCGSIASRCHMRSPACDGVPTI